MTKLGNLTRAIALAAPLAVLPTPVQADGLDDLANNIASRIRRAAPGQVYIIETVPSAYITQEQIGNFIGKVEKLIEEGGVGVGYKGGFRPSKIIEGEIPTDVWEYTFSPSSSVNH